MMKPVPLADVNKACAGAPFLAPGEDGNLASALARQDGRVLRREYEPLGMLETVQFDTEGLAADSDYWQRLKSERSVISDPRLVAMFDWYKTGPLLGFSADQKELLVVSPMPPPPKIPDPDWEPTLIYDPKGQASLKQEEKPLIEQKLARIATGRVQINRRKWMVFQPIHQLLLIDVRRRGFITVHFVADSFGRHCCLLYSLHRQRGHFLCGQVQVENHFAS